MGSRQTRPRFLTVTAILAALVWGAVECLALQWSRILDRQKLRDRAKRAW